MDKFELLKLREAYRLARPEEKEAPRQAFMAGLLTRIKANLILMQEPVTELAGDIAELAVMMGPDDCIWGFEVEHVGQAGVACYILNWMRSDLCEDGDGGGDEEFK